MLRKREFWRDDRRRRTWGVEAFSKRKCSNRVPPMPTTKAKTENTSHFVSAGGKIFKHERREKI
jgi:hypothetical protein